MNNKEYVYLKVTTKITANLLPLNRPWPVG